MWLRLNRGRTLTVLKKKDPFHRNAYMLSIKDPHHNPNHNHKPKTKPKPKPKPNKITP